MHNYGKNKLSAIFITLAGDNGLFFYPHIESLPQLLSKSTRLSTSKSTGLFLKAFLPYLR